MNKTKKGILAGLTVFIIGAVVFVISLAVLDWDVFKIDSTVYTAKHYSITAEETQTVKSVELDLDSFPVTVKTGDSVALDYYEASDSVVTVALENGVLKIREKAKGMFFIMSLFKFGRINRRYALTVPNGVTLNVKGKNGDVTLEGMETDKMIVNSTNLDLSLSGCTLNTLNVSSTNADIEIVNCAVGSSDIYGTNINIEVRNSEFETLSVKGTNADVGIFDTAAVSVSAKATNADCNFRRIVTDSVFVEATNLDAYISVKGIKSEYTVDTRGWGDLPQKQTGTVPGKQIFIGGTNCDAELAFV